jgi:hypothetical protein
VAKSKRGSKSDTAQYSNYKTGNKEAKNRLTKLTRLAKEQPNNLQVTMAVKDIHHRRHIPKEAYWSHQMIAMAKIMKEFKGKFDKNIFNADPIIHAAAAHVRNEKAFEHLKLPTSSPHQMGWLKERAHTKDGILLWK